MINGIPKISVLVICYKQEELIKRAINSLLAQKDYIYEICVSDDCSPDKTWEVLQEYDRQYPGLFKIHRNEPNVGIFENIEYTWTMPTGDVVYRLAGDDECGKDWFKTVIEYIQNNNIDYKNELFCIYGDFEKRYPNGDSLIRKNRAVLYNTNHLKLSLRGIIGNRSCCYSIKVLKKFKKCSQGRSHIAEDAIDRQLQLYSEKNYYIPKVGNIYYTYVGESKKLADEVVQERTRIRQYTLTLFEQWGAAFDNKDKVYSLQYFPVHQMLVYQPSIKIVLQFVWLSIKCYDRSIKKAASLHDFIFALRRRLPHTKPVKM